MGRHLSALLAILMIAAAAPSPVFLRAQARGTVAGTVTDAESGLPLENVNVYLSSTTFGGNTDRTGKFVLPNIPPGVFQLVASRVGYRLQSTSLRISGGGSVSADFRLVPVTLEGDEVQILAHVDREWHRLLAEFRRAFLGEGSNAPGCSLENPEVLNFSKERGTDILRASTDSTLRIENRTLGYNLYARLAVFEWDVADDRGRFLLYPRFEALSPRDSQEMESWRLNRQKSYNGSLKHFLSALVAARLEQEHFLVNAGPLATLRAGAERPFTPEDFSLLPVPGQPLWRLMFDKWLRIEYRDERIHLASYIGLNGGSALLDASGNLVDPLCMEVIGDWTNYRVADMLPLE